MSGGPTIEWDWCPTPGVRVIEVLDDQGVVVETATMSDDAGTFTLSSIEPGRTYTLRETWKTEGFAPVVTTTTVERREQP